MKQIILFLSALFSITSLSAQTSDQILAKLEQSAPTHKTYAVSIAEKRILAGTKKTVDLKGKLEYRKDDGYLTIKYDGGDYFLIDGNTMTMVNGANKMEFDLSKNLMMRGLQHALLYSFQGRLQDLSAEQGADIEAKKDGSVYVVKLTAKKKSPRGYSSIIVKYALDGAIRAMDMIEFNGACTKYSIAD